MNYAQKVNFKIKKYFELEILTEDDSKRKLSPNYLNKARHNFLLAKFIKEGTSSQKILQQLGFDATFRAFDWVINASYYAMYMAAQAVLAAIGIKCENHTATPYALEYFFVFKNKLESDYVAILRKHQHLIDEKDLEKLREGKNARQTAQYDVAKTMEEKVALAVLKDAGIFVERMEQLLAAISK